MPTEISPGLFVPPSFNKKLEQKGDPGCCGCGKLLCYITERGVEIRCKKCKRVTIFQPKSRSSADSRELELFSY